jgi:predicted nucleotidyltransferase
MKKSNHIPEISNFEDPILRDFFVTKEGLIFSVPDYCHPKEGIRSVLRYIPDADGPRIRRPAGKRYRKADFFEALDYLKEHHPDWVFDLAVVPRSEIVEILKPNDAVIEILEGKKEHPAAFELIRRFMDTGTPISSMGITGSILAGLENEESDIDFLVYGNDWFAAKEALKKMKADDAKKAKPFKISELNTDMWKTVYNKRKSPLAFEDFFEHEIRKGNRGMLVGGDCGGQNIYFDLLFVRSIDQPAGPIQRGTDTEKTVIEAVIINDDFAFDSPAIYLIDHDEIDEIYSYTHTYAGQAQKGERVRARGMLEVIGDKKRLVIGTSREAEDEWLISLSLLEASEK